MGAERGNNVGRPTFGGKFVKNPHFKKEKWVYRKTYYSTAVNLIAKYLRAKKMSRQQS
jgi:hypothetical protein